MKKMATNTGVNPDLQKERDGASFDSEKMTNFLYGGPEKVKRKRTIESLVLNDPDCQHEDLNFLSREQRYETLLKRTLLMVTKMQELKVNEEDQRFWETLMIEDVPPLTIHTGRIIPTLRAQATDEQQNKWLKMAENYTIVVSYAQTEMGHGTYVQGLETTATFDPKTQEFILNTPTLTAAKWWPGDLGKTSNHVLLMAQLRIHGKSYGPHLFMVQIRSMEDHKPLPGITVGDIGPKFGNSVDNGFLMLDNVRIPRENMLMKNSKVEPDGTYVKPSNPKLAYGSMVHARSQVVKIIATPMAMAATVAIRYSCVRRQSVVKAGHPELQVLDYVTQQYKLFPHLAATFAFWLTGQTMQAVYDESFEQIFSTGNNSALSELHALSTGLKALSTWVVTSGIEECRLACGGHGYFHASGLPRLYADMSASVTIEGENTVLMLQTARYLMKSYNRSLQGKKLVRTVEYLSDVPPVLPVTGRDKNLLDVEVLCDAYRHRAARLIRDAADQLMSEMKSGKDLPDAWNATSVDLVKAATAHSQYFVVKNFAERLTDPTVDSSISDILARLFQLHALHGLMNNSGDFLEDGYMTGKEIRQARRHVTTIMAKLRPDAVALVDAFDIPDGVLKSILGRYDGNVYQHLLEWAKASPLNKTDVYESYYKYLKPFLQANKAKL